MSLSYLIKFLPAVYNMLMTLPYIVIRKFLTFSNVSVKLKLISNDSPTGRMIKTYCSIPISFNISFSVQNVQHHITNFVPTIRIAFAVQNDQSNRKTLLNSLVSISTKTSRDANLSTKSSSPVMQRFGHCATFNDSRLTQFESRLLKLW